MTDADQLDAMLHGWLERSAELRRPGRPGVRATAVLMSAPGVLPALRRLCARWNASVETRGALALVSGPALVVDGVVAVTGLAEPRGGRVGRRTNAPRMLTKP